MSRWPVVLVTDIMQHELVGFGQVGRVRLVIFLVVIVGELLYEAPIFHLLAPHEKKSSLKSFDGFGSGLSILAQGRRVAGFGPLELVGNHPWVEANLAAHP